MNTPLQRQTGMTLIVGLIMLILMTVMAISSFRISRISTDIMGNMQHRNEVTAAANAAVQEAISTPRLFEAPGNVFINPPPCNGTPNTRCVDVNGDDITDITVVLDPIPNCVQASVIQNAALNLAVASDETCIVGDRQLYGVEGIASGNSACADSIWEITARATDAVTGADVTVVEGAAVRVDAATVIGGC